MPAGGFPTGTGQISRRTASAKSSIALPMTKADWPSTARGSALPWPKRCSRSAGLMAWRTANRQQPIMQPERPLLPEFYMPRHDPEPGPGRRARYPTLPEAIRKRRDPALELGAAAERARLLRGPGADLAVARPAGKIRIGLAVRDPLDRTFDANLPVHRLPEKAQRGIGVGEQLDRLAALEIGVEDKPALIEPLQQNDASRRPSVGSRRRQRHGVGVGLALPSLVEPTSKGCKRFELGDLVDHTIGVSWAFRRDRAVPTPRLGSRQPSALHASGHS